MFPERRGDAEYPAGVDRQVLVPPRDDLLLSYRKGPLVVRAIARRIGPQVMEAALRDFFTRWRGQVVGWDALAESIGVVAGAEAANDARQRFADPAWPEDSAW